MRIALYDVDSKIPNLSLMKISQWHKQQGHSTHRYLRIMHRTYDKIYASKIFDFSDGSNITDDMITGGTGIDLKITLPPEIEECSPDYSLYRYPHNIGFAMRGCRFACKFCVVPRKEGRPRSNNSIAQIWTQRSSDFLVLLDNDFFGNPLWKERIAEIRELDLRVNFSQGINIRILTEEQAQALKSVRFRNLKGTHATIHFAWDRFRDEKLIRRGINRCIKAGIKPYQMTFYVLVGFDTTKEQDMHRIELLRSFGCDPYVMPYDTSDPYQKAITRWVNHKAIFNICTFEEYKAKKGIVL